MDYKKITAEDIAGKGVVGQADTPLLSALEMQNKVEEVPRAVIIPHFNSLIDSLDIRDADVDSALSDRYTKTETDAAIARTVTEIGAGDMQKAIYDTDGDGVVDNAVKLGGKTPSQLTFGADQIITDNGTDKRLPQTLEEKMDKTGGDFWGHLTQAKGFGFDFATGEGYKLRLIGDGSSNYAFLQVTQADGTWIADVLKINTVTGAIEGGVLMPKSGGRFTGWVDTATTARAGICLRCNKVTSSEGWGNSYVVSTDHLVFQRK